jgi:hypothetical protein
LDILVDCFQLQDHAVPTDLGFPSCHHTAAVPGPTHSVLLETWYHSTVIDGLSCRFRHEFLLLLILELDQGQAIGLRDGDDDA